MSEGSARESELPKGFREYADLQLQQNQHLNGKMDGLITQVGTMVEAQSDFMRAMVKSEERHTSHTAQITRLEDNQKEQGRDLKDYIHNNDERVNTVEKQVLLLDKDVGNNAKPWNTVKTIIISIAGTVLGAAALLAVLPK